LAFYGERFQFAVLIHVQEGQPVRVTGINVSVADAPRPKRLEPSFSLPLKANEIFDQGSYENSEDALHDLYRNHSYAYAQTSRRAVVEADSRKAHVWYAVKAGVPGLFGETKVIGTRNVERSLVLRELVYRKGEPFDARKISTSRQNLLALNLFSEIEFSAGENPRDRAIVPIEIRVRERPPRNLSLSLGYNTQSLLNARLAWSHYNFFGGGRQLTLECQLFEHNELPRRKAAATPISIEAIDPRAGAQTGAAKLSDLSTQYFTLPPTADLQFLDLAYGLRRLAPGVS